MGITTKQREMRRKHLGSSDVAAIVGVDRFKNAYDVYLDKTGKIEDEPENAVMQRGRLLEPAILSFAEFALGPIVRDPEKLEFIDEALHLLSHPDGIVEETGNPIETKSQGAYSEEVWGEANTDQVPDRVIIQAHVHMICTKKDYCHTPAYLAYREFQMFGLSVDADVRNIIIEKAADFWQNNVLKDMPPENVAPAMAVIKRIRREPKTIVDIDDALVESWLGAKETAKVAKKAKEDAEAALLASLGTAEAGQCKSGIVSYLLQHRKGYVVADTSFRVPRFKKAK